MKKLVFHLIFLLIISPTGAQIIINRDPEISRMVDEISSERIENYVRTLVSFHTRHNMSSRDNSSHGIGAAWNWVRSEMEKNIPASEGRLEVKFEEYTVGGKGQRIPYPVHLKNVVATLKGTDSNDDRKILISAHLDSRAQLDNDSTSFAPGANDDGSGIAALLEMVRIMSSRIFPATIIFMAVTGEEHGLYGARHMAAKAKNENWNIVAMLNNDMIGNSGSSETILNDNMRVRVFSEGVPAFETEQMAALEGTPQVKMTESASLRVI
jgi:acetylornithine deacetylase/succinyl-diaminopimelate desuccinylase-like protein